ncbi:MAG: hypothetical protein HQL35_09070, partial [Alphaproteobacteria bacterium]|nr:hypothetical protein [Alphaproteobacteria bacterium]
YHNPITQKALGISGSAAQQAGWIGAGIATNPGEALPRGGAAIQQMAQELYEKARNYGNPKDKG